MDRINKIKILNNFIKEIDLSQQIKLSFFKGRSEVPPNAFSLLENKKVFIDEILLKNLEIEELKSLLAHEVAHFRYSKTGNPFWYYFVFKYSWFLYLCSFSFTLPPLFRVVILSLLLFMSTFFILKSRKESERAREIENKCDEFSVRINGKVNFLRLLNKIEQIQQHYNSLDSFICKKIFGEYHPSFKSRKNKVNSL